MSAADLPRIEGGDHDGEVAVWRLAADADCGAPDSFTSPGATWLVHVAESALEAWQWAADEAGVDWAADWERWAEDAADEVADQAPPVYTHELWSVFVDLAAYQQDIDDLASEDYDMEQRARLALYVIARNVASQLFEEWGDEVEPPEESTCRYCDRDIMQVDGVWIDPEATGDDRMWRETCDKHDTFTAEHEPSDA